MGVYSPAVFVSITRKLRINSAACIYPTPENDLRTLPNQETGLQLYYLLVVTLQLWLACFVIMNILITVFSVRSQCWPYRKNKRMSNGDR